VKGLQWFLSLLIIFVTVLFMPHKRSLQGKISQRQREQDYAVIKVQRKAAWQFIRETEFRDRLIGETVSCTDINSITDKLAEVFGQPESEAVPNVEQGSVLDCPLREL
jgi:hypothetical protein